MATFAQPLLRLGLFFSGILGCVMIASGLLLWSLKRQLQSKNSQFHFGYYLVDLFKCCYLCRFALCNSCLFVCESIVYCHGHRC
ncbi:PepSY-associated TM helix domain-containing protein [Acinetobacter baumannii]